MRQFLFVFLIVLYSCNSSTNPNDLGLVDKLPKGEYIIWNQGSRHIVKCLRSDGKYYWLNDAHFKANGIDGYDAHQYMEKTKIIIK